MHIRTFVVGLALLLVPPVVAAQTSQGGESGRFSVQAGAAPLLNGDGHALSGAFGFSPVPRVDLVVSVESVEIPFERRVTPDRVSLLRGGTLTFVSGEVRAVIVPNRRVVPYGLAGIGDGISRPTVNEFFPDVVENDLRVVYFGGGLRVPLGAGVSVYGDARAMLALESYDSVLGICPVRGGVAWRF